MTRPQMLYVDMDGTLTEYRMGLPQAAYSEKGFYITLKPHANVVKAINSLIERQKKLGIRLCALSSVAKEAVHAEREKIDWLSLYVPELEYRFLPWMMNKSDYVDDLRPEDALLDDFNVNLQQWRGTKIKLVNGVNDRTGSWGGPRVYFDDPPEEIAERIINILMSARPR